MEFIEWKSTVVKQRRVDLVMEPSQKKSDGACDIQTATIWDATTRMLNAMLEVACE